MLGCVIGRLTGRHRRQVADEQHRQAFLRHLIHRPEGQAMPVREDEPFVDPGAVGQRCWIELARREHHLAHSAVDFVAVVVDRDEVVVRPDLLNLPERLEQRLMIPEPDVIERLAIPLDVGARELGVAGQLPFLDAVEREPLARGRDVVRDVRRLASLFVGRHDEPLDELRVESATEQHDRVEASGGGERPRRAIQRLQQREHHADAPQPPGPAPPASARARRRSLRPE